MMRRNFDLLGIITLIMMPLNAFQARKEEGVGRAQLSKCATVRNQHFVRRGKYYLENEKQNKTKKRCRILIFLFEFS